MTPIDIKKMKNKEEDLKQFRKIMLNNIKHDLANPINAILGYSELILDILIQGNNKILEKDIRSIHESGTQMHERIQNMFPSKSVPNEDDFIKIINNNELQFTVRTPLSNVIGFTELIREDLLSLSKENRPIVQDSVEKINRAGKNLLRLLNDLSKYSEFNIEELMEKYYTDLYLKDQSLRDFDFHTNVKIPIKKGNILIVDDESINLDLIDKILQQSKHMTYTAKNSLEALNILKEQSSIIDLILLDLIMPGMNGIELLQKLKEDTNTYHIPVIMLSALDDMDTIVECITLGADDFLMKPVNRFLLDARINNSLEKKYFHDKELKYQEKIKQEQNKSDTLLLNILPNSIADRLKNGETLIADDIENATVLFADLTGFTELSSTMSAKKLLLLLNNIFSEFDELVIKHSLEKIKTIGDSYMLAGGIPEPSKNHAVSVSEMALEMLEVLPKIKTKPHNSLQIRIGINSGPVSAGVIGKKKFIYDLWGDTVNIASRMETYGLKNKIHVNDKTYKILKNIYQFEKRDKIDIPGKGMMQTYFLKGHKT